MDLKIPLNQAWDTQWNPPGVPELRISGLDRPVNDSGNDTGGWYSFVFDGDQAKFVRSYADGRDTKIVFSRVSWNALGDGVLHFNGDDVYGTVIKGKAVGPGSDGGRFPTRVPSADDVTKWLSDNFGDNSSLGDSALKYALKMQLIGSKLLVGLVRFVFEDLYQGTCQMIYLCKVWLLPQTTWSTKFFVMGSVSAGIFCSVCGPVREVLAYRASVRHDAVAEEANKFGFDNPVAAQREGYQRIASQPDPEITKAKAAMDTSGQASALASEARVQASPPLRPLRELLVDRGCQYHAFIRAAILTASFAYWTTMAFVYFDVQVGCGQAAPLSDWLLFFALCLFCQIAECLIVTYGTLDSQFFRSRECLLGVIFSNIGRFDVFSDIVNVISINACVAADLDSFTWFSVKGTVYQLPTDLGTMVNFGLFMVLALQAVPGIYLLVQKKYMPVALKFNDCCLVLAAMEMEK